MNWTWYLQNDFQFILVTPLYLFAYRRSAVLGVSLVVATIVASIAACAWRSASHLEFVTIDFMGKKKWSDENDIYIRPWCVFSWCYAMILACIPCVL
jgi:hypothetical protein